MRREALQAEAANAYYAAYLAIGPLKALPGDQALAKPRELLHDANNKADIAQRGNINNAYVSVRWTAPGSPS